MSYIDACREYRMYMHVLFFQDAAIALSSLTLSEDNLTRRSFPAYMWIPCSITDTQ